MTNKDDLDIMNNCFKKYMNRFGYITLDNHVRVYLEAMEQMPFREIEDGLNEYEFNIRRKGMIEMVRIIQDIMKAHHANGIPVKVDLNELK